MTRRTLLALPLLAVTGVVFAGWSSLHAQRAAVVGSAPTAVTTAPTYTERIAGAGLIEPASENIDIGAPTNALVTAVPVHIGQLVAADAVLFQLDDRIERAALARAEAELALARSESAVLSARPRPEELPPANARVTQARSELAEAIDLRTRGEEMAPNGVISREEFARRRFAAEQAAARLSEAEAALALLRAGTWQPELTAAAARVAAAESVVSQAHTAVNRLTVRAPVAGTILRVELRPGEWAGTGSLLTLGDCSTLNLRVDIDEQDAWRFSPTQPGSATVRGNQTTRHALTFVRTEPAIRPKRSLTGDSSERIDTRVLQVIYRIEDSTGLFVGQQMDAQIQVTTKNESAAP